MAYADFDIASHAGNTGGFVDGPEGSPVLHSSLSSPLVGEDLFARTYVRSSGVVGVLYMLNDVNFVGIPSTKSVSLRAWVRRELLGFGNGIGLIAKSGITAGASVQRQVSGYFFGFAPVGGDDSNALGFMAHDGAADNNSYIINGSGSGGGVDEAEPNFAGFSAATWYKLRMDVLPIGSGNDQVDMYTGVGTTGSEVWTLEHSFVASSGDPWWVPHAHGSSNKYGFYVYDSNSGLHNRIDRFQIFTETA